MVKKEYKLSELCQLLYVTPKTLGNYIENGKLKAHKKEDDNRGNGGTWYVYLDDFGQMLCEVPTLRHRFKEYCEKAVFSGNIPVSAVYLTKYLAKHEWILSVLDVANLCDVTHQCVRLWMRKGWIESSFSNTLFAVSDVKDLFRTHPKTKAYLNPRALGWSLLNSEIRAIKKGA